MSDQTSTPQNASSAVKPSQRTGRQKYRASKRLEFAKRAADVSKYYLEEKLTQEQIGEKLDLDQSTISETLHILQQEWLKTAAFNFDKAKAKELARIDHLEVQYWAAWKRSCEKSIKEGQTLEGPQPAAGEALTISKRKAMKFTTNRDGDPRFLEGVRWCVQKRCEILGFDAPKKIEQSGTLTLRKKYEEMNEGEIRQELKKQNELLNRHGVFSVNGEQTPSRN